MRCSVIVNDIIAGSSFFRSVFTFCLRDNPTNLYADQNPNRPPPRQQPHVLYSGGMIHKSHVFETVENPRSEAHMATISQFDIFSRFIIPRHSDLSNNTPLAVFVA